MKNGDIVVYETDELKWILIFEEWYRPYEGHIHYHTLLVCPDEFYDFGTCFITDEDCLRESTEDERKLLFDKIKENGYKWDSESIKLVRL